MSVLSVVRKSIHQSVIDTLPDIPLLDMPLEKGDLYVLKNWKKDGFMNVLTYQHAGMISDVTNSSIEHVDCVRGGCRVKTFDSEKKGKELYIARLPMDIPYRDEIIQEGIAISKYLISHHKVTYLKLKQYHVGQILRILVGKCMGSVGWDELTQYIRRFLKPYIHNMDYDGKTFTVFCNRFSMLIYQLAAWYVFTKHKKSNEEIAELLNKYFAFHPKYCRPWHVLMLGKGPHPWTVFRTVTWFKE